MFTLATIALFLPLFGFLLLSCFFKLFRRKPAEWIACATIFFSFLIFAYLTAQYMNSRVTSEIIHYFPWISFGNIQANFSLKIDSLSLLMALIITGVGFLIHLYSIGYIEHEEDYTRFFACLNFFVFAMLLLVLSNELLLLFVGWEGVGLASYLLIGYWYTRPAAAQAAVKAFVVNRIGDLGFLLGLLLCFYLFGTTEIDQIAQTASQQFGVGDNVLTILTLLLFVGAIGKSAQLPLHVWLPDAMEGPTPVSALIHAATMVTAGVYLVVRMHGLFILVPSTLEVIGWVGALTSLYAAFSAVGQTDLKRVLAYSTVSQLGLMFLACGVGAFYAAMFHLTTHAFIKALLFLSAGNVVHMMHGNTDLAKMGGLKHKLPYTNVLFLIGVLAMSAVPPLAAFFSKDLILEQGYNRGYYLLFGIGLATSLLTAFYLTRAYLLAFMGELHLSEKIAKVIHEAPRIMLAPISVLAFCSVFGGLLGYFFGRMPVLESFLSKSIPLDEGASFHLSLPTILSVLGAFLGIGVAWMLYRQLGEKLGKPIAVLKNGFYFDPLYQKMIVSPLAALAQFIGHVSEPKILDGAVRAIGSASEGIAKNLQKMQSGQIRSYIAWMVLGTVFLIAYLVF